jgi:hypothetical protein
MLVWKTTWVSWIFLMVAGWVVPAWVKRIARRAAGLFHGPDAPIASLTGQRQKQGRPANRLEIFRLPFFPDSPQPPLFIRVSK